MAKVILAAIGVFISVHAIAAYLLWWGGFNFADRSVDAAAAAFTVLFAAGALGAVAFDNVRRRTWFNKESE